MKTILKWVFLWALSTLGFGVPLSGVIFFGVGSDSDSALKLLLESFSAANEPPEVSSNPIPTEGSSAAQNQGQHPQGAPEAKTGTSSSLSGSRVERWLYPEQEVSSSARNLDPGEQPQAPAPAEDPELLTITRSIIAKMKLLYPNDPWNPDNPLIRGEKIFAGGKGKKHIRPMTIEELLNIFNHLERDGKKSYWAKELHRRIDTWTWQNPRGPS